MTDDEYDGDRIRLLDETYIGSICDVTNSAAEMYYGTLPERCYSRPYTTRDDARKDIEEGVVYWGYFLDSEVVGVIGIQEMGISGSNTNEDGSRDSHVDRDPDVDIGGDKGFVAVRRLYVVPDFQRKGIGTSLLRHCLDGNPDRDVYTVTWKDASWAIEFYEKNGFENLGTQTEIIKRYWSPPEGCENEFVVLVFEK